MNTYLIEIKEKSDKFNTIGVLTNLLKVYMKDGVINHFRVTELTAQKNGGAEPSASDNNQMVAALWELVSSVEARDVGYSFQNSDWVPVNVERLNFAVEKYMQSYAKLHH